MNIEEYMMENSSYKSIIREYVKSHLLGAFKRYPTSTQDAILYVISSRLEELYLYTVRFPEIVSPNSTRLDILQAILEQFEFQLRKDADIEEQLNILENILHVYNKRGSIDTIENMWKYYGGDLPKEVQVKIPSYNIFRYNISKFSGKDVFQDDETHRSDVYEIVLSNNYYPINDLKEFMLQELIAAGTRIYFTNRVYSLLVDGEDGAASEYNVHEDTFIHTNMRTTTYRSGMAWGSSGALSSNTKNSIWSGRPDLFFELTHTFFLDLVKLGDYIPIGGFSRIKVFDTDMPSYDEISVNLFSLLERYYTVSYTLEDIIPSIERYLYDSEGNLIESAYPGYFIFGETLLGSEVL